MTIRSIAFDENFFRYCCLVSYAMKSPTSSADMFQSRDCKSPYINYKNTQNSEFGNFQETYNWIECESISFPGKTYFFNLRTQCSTWVRPVSKHVQLQYFKKKLRICNDNFTSDLDNPLITISDSEDKNNICDMDKQIDEKEQDKKVNFWHPEFSTNSNCNTHTNNFNNNAEEYSNDNFSYISEKFCEKDSYSILHDLICNEIIEDFSAENNFEKCMSEIKLLDTKRKEQSLSKDDVPIHPVLQLKSITPDCLIKEKVQRKNTEYRERKKMKKSTNTQTQLKKLKLKTKLKGNKKKEKKVMCQTHSTVTVDYKPKPEFPPGIKVTNLSDSSTTSLSCHTNDAKSAILSNFEIPNVKSCINLSNESKSSCSCSCTSSNSTDISKTK